MHPGMKICPACKAPIPLRDGLSRSSGPPSVVDTLVREISRIGMARFSDLPPRGVLEMAKYWIAHNAPADERFDAPREIPTLSKDGVRWACPYHERLVGTLRAFALMVPADRRIVIAGIEGDRVWWRGESARNYADIVRETLRMRVAGIETYRKEVTDKLKNFLSGNVAHDPEALAERAAIQSE